VEAEAGVVPFFIDGEMEGFNKTYFLVDGIYPRYTRFVKGMRDPILEQDKRFTKWQESARKDIERAFGVLQCRFKAIAYPIHFINQDSIYHMAACCLILHNMLVQERVMGNCTDRYDPSVEADPEDVDVVEAALHPAGVGDMIPPLLVDEPEMPLPPPVRLLRHIEPNVAMSIIRQREFMGLKDQDEWGRLQAAMIRLKGHQVMNA
jgi:hypothetical protein